jgi:hypothetical protein
MKLGGSALMAIDVLKSRGVPEEHILFLNLIASPEGAQNLADKFPKVRVVTAFVDAGLDEKKYVHSSLAVYAVLTGCVATSYLDWVTLATASTPCKAMSSISGSSIAFVGRRAAWVSFSMHWHEVVRTRMHDLEQFESD